MTPKWTESDRRAYADKVNDERTPTGHIVTIYADDPPVLKQQLRDEADRHGWTVVYRDRYQ